MKEGAMVTRGRANFPTTENAAISRIKARQTSQVKQLILKITWDITRPISQSLYL